MAKNNTFILLQPNKLCVTIEEAKSFAAEYVLSQLALQADGSPAVVPVPAVLAPPAPTYQVCQENVIDRLVLIMTSYANTQYIINLNIACVNKHHTKHIASLSLLT